MATSSPFKFDVSNRVFTLFVVVIVALTAYWGFSVYQMWQSSQGEYPRQITVDAEGSAYVVPDIAKLNIGINADAELAESAVTDGANKINAMMDTLQKAGIEKADIKTTNYSLNKKTVWEDKGGYKEVGYTLNQSLEVKVRDLTKVGAIIASSISAGGNLVGGINFDVDDAESAKNEARADALKKIEAKVAQISKVSGVSFGKVVNYYESTNGMVGYGGGVPMMEMAADSKAMAVQAPSAPPGEQEIKLNVSITYKMK